MRADLRRRARLRGRLPLQPEQVLDFFPNYEPDAAGFPVHPTRAVSCPGWAASSDRFENWLSNRYQRPQAFAAEVRAVEGGEVVRRTVAVANRSRDGVEDDSDNPSRSASSRHPAG
jgi:hypothetical protein